MILFNTSPIVSDQNREWSQDLRTAGLAMGLYSPQHEGLCYNDVISIIENRRLNSKTCFIPVVFNADDSTKDYELSPAYISREMYTTHEDYVGVRNFFKYGQSFTQTAPALSKRAEAVRDFNIKVQSFVKSLSSKHKTICAFQTRNIPHIGHEAIIRSLLQKYHAVVINPVIGWKKQGDVKAEVLETAFNYLISNIFAGEKLFYAPIISEMHYAGPREACHHALIRKNLGFTHFSVGRDHAGAENAYPQEAAMIEAKNYANDIGIHIDTSGGAFYCNLCEKVTTGSSCPHPNLNGNHTAINGSDFRKAIQGKHDYLYGRTEVIKHLRTIHDDLFVV